ncbi:MAG: hypothetical protein GY701_32395 [Sulfitobacter sp.]|nr:hypothetical protein [Sulfitobacter sp.]
MAKLVLYAYVDGYDLHDVEDLLISSLEDFISVHHWSLANVRVVNQREDSCEGMEDGYYPRWDLGLNMDLPNLDSDTESWFCDVDTVISFLGKLHEKSERDFVVGIYDVDRMVADDLFYVDKPRPDIEELRLVIFG